MDLAFVMQAAGETAEKTKEAGEAGSTIDWSQFGAAIAAIGALGVAAFGVTEAAGKALAFTTRRPGAFFGLTYVGLPYAGMGVVGALCKDLGPALQRIYGANYLSIIAHEYRGDRAKSRAPDLIRQGVRLGLPFLPLQEAADLLGRVWNMDPEKSRQLALSLQADQPTPPAGKKPTAAEVKALEEGMALAGRFSAALEAKISAAFAVAEERYQAYAKLLAGVVAVALALGFNEALKTGYSEFTAILIGLVAVPLAPVAKDLASSLQNALTAFKSIPSRRA
jgi:hypothetical protein